MKCRQILLTTGIFFLSILVSSCTLYQKPEISPIKIPTDFKFTVQSRNPYLKNYWWENFHDAQLNQLVCLAIHNNLNYQIAIKNIQIAQTYVAQAQSALLPQVNLNYGISRNKLSDNGFSSFNPTNQNLNSSMLPFRGLFDLEQLYASVIYELDVWNQVGNSVHQAQANVTVSKADSKVVKLTLISTVTGNYFQINALNSTLENLHQQYVCAVEIVKLTKDKFQSGLINIAAVDDAKNQVEAIKIKLDNLEKQRKILLNSMAYLLGKYPECFGCPINKPMKNPGFTKLIPEGVPCSMLANRPDIQSAYYQIVAYGYLEKQNIANFLPSFYLTGNDGFSTANLAEFIAKRSVFWNYGTNILQPIFDYGLRMSEYTRSKLQFESAALNYKNTVINAFNEVDSALASYKEDYTALHAYENQLTNLKDKLNLADAQFQAGLTDYITYLTAKLSYLQSSYNLSNQQLMVIEDIVQVYKALGLGLCDEEKVS
jgi:outer membrane protein, multidrug efflux system